MEIMENRRKGRWKVTSFMWGGKWRKIMENLENTSLVNKRFLSISWQDFTHTYGFHSILSLSLSLSHTPGYLYFSWRNLGWVWHALDLDQDGKRKVGNHKRATRSVATAGFFCKYRVACMVSLLVFACMVYACGFLVMIYHSHGGLPRLIVNFPHLSISWIALVLWVHFHCLFFWLFIMIPLVMGWVTSSWSLGWINALELDIQLLGWVTSPRALVGKILWSPRWVELLVLELWLDKHSGAQKQLGLS